MSLTECEGKLKCVGTAAEALARSELFVACLCSVNSSQRLRLVLQCIVFYIFSFNHISTIV